MSQAQKTHIAFSTWLDPNESVFEGISGVGSGSNAKASVDDIAPISPSKLRGWLNTISGL
jgi:hypothetical protein